VSPKKKSLGRFFQAFQRALLSLKGERSLSEAITVFVTRPPAEKSKQNPCLFFKALYYTFLAQF
jgi:hypothetical protein